MIIVVSTCNVCQTKTRHQITYAYCVGNPNYIKYQVHSVCLECGDATTNLLTHEELRQFVRANIGR